MTYLELVRELARATGTLRTADPVNSEIATLVDADDHLADLARWIRKSWVSIQLQSDWSFMIKSGSVDISQPSVVSLTTEIADFSRILPYRGRWINVGDRERAHLIHYDQWERYKQLYRSPGRPRFFTITPQDEMAVLPEPDVEYNLSFDYQKTAQELSADSDVPELPEQFHDVIVYRALVKYGGFDEAPAQLQRAVAEHQELMTQMHRRFLPEYRVIGNK